MSNARILVNPRLIRLRHAQHYIAVARLADNLYIAGDQLSSRGITLFDRDRINLDTARQWLQTHAGDSDVDALLVADAEATMCIGNLRYLAHYERIIQLDTALGAAQRLNHRHMQANFLGNLGVALAGVGSTRPAITEFEQQLVLACDIGERRSEANALGNLGLGYANLGDIRQALWYYQQALTITQEIGDRRGEENALNNLGNGYVDLGELHQAIAYYEQRLAIAHEIRHRHGVAQTLGNLGLAYAALGDISTAIMYHQQSLAFMRKIGDRRGEGSVLGNLGLAYEALAEWHRAIDYYQQHLMVACELGDRRGEAHTSWNLGRVYVRENRMNEALPLLEQHVAYARAIGHPNAELDAAMVEYLQQYGMWPQGRLDMEQILQELEPLLHGIADSINGDSELRREITVALDDLEGQGWMLREPVERIWAGDRNHTELIARLDEQDRLIIEQVLKLITDKAIEWRYTNLHSSV